MHCKCACWVNDQIKFLVVNVKRCEDFNNDEETEYFRRRNLLDFFQMKNFDK